VLCQSFALCPPHPPHPIITPMPGLSVATMAITSHAGIDFESWSGLKDDKKVTSRETVPVAFLSKRFMPPHPSHRTHDADTLCLSRHSVTSCAGIDRGRDLDTWSKSKDDKKVTSRRNNACWFSFRNAHAPPPPTIPPPP
jgi:hypothetical protein